MKHLRQPKNSHLCGQCCVAMAAGVSLDAVIALLGRGRTTHREVTAALRALRVRPGPWRRRRLASIEGPALVSIGPAEGEGHWVYLQGGRVYDPAIRAPVPTVIYCLWMLVSGTRVWSYFTVRKVAT